MTVVAATIDPGATLCNPVGRHSLGCAARAGDRARRRRGAGTARPDGVVPDTHRSETRASPAPGASGPPASHVTGRTPLGHTHRMVYPPARAASSTGMLAAWVSVAALLAAGPSATAGSARAPSEAAVSGAASAAGLVAAAASAGQEGTAVRCPALDPLGPAADPDLYCIDLVHAPGLPGASGYVELTPPPSPFGASVTADGHHRFDLTLHAAGLPDPAALGDYTGYVAWATTPRLRPVRNLGPVANGRTALDAVDLDKFLVLVTAEARPDAPAWDGRIVLRGTSAGMRMEPEDLLAVTGMVSGADPPLPARGWLRPPMHPSVAMMPGIGRLTPPVDSFLPSAEEALLPAARPHEIVRLGDGGTLDLEAGLVRRTIDGRTLTMYGYNGQYPRPPHPGAAGRDDHRQRHEPARSADRRALARHPARQPLRRGPRPHAGSHRAGRDVPVPHPLPRRRPLLVPPAPPRGRATGPRAVRLPAGGRARPGLVRPREPRAGADARRPAGRRGGCRRRRRGRRRGRRHAPDPLRPRAVDPRADGPLREPAARQWRAELPPHGRPRRGGPLLPDQRLEHADVQPVVRRSIDQGRRVGYREVRAADVGGERGHRAGGALYRRGPLRRAGRGAAGQPRAGHRPRLRQFLPRRRRAGGGSR